MAFVQKLSRFMYPSAGAATDTEEDINEATTFPRAERHAPSLLSDASLSSYNGGVRRTWIQGEWASGRPKPERKRSMLANTFFCVLLLASVPLLAVYLKHGDALATFGNHSLMLPWLSSAGQSGSRGEYERRREGKTEGEVRRADEQQPWRGREAERGAGSGMTTGKEREKRAMRAVEQAEWALANARGGKVASSRPLRPTPLTLPVHGQPAGHANAAGKRGIGMAEMELKYKAAEREVRALEGKVGQLERKVVRERVGSADSQAAAVANAEAEITRLQHELSTLETQVSARRHLQRSDARREEALEQDNLKLHRALAHQASEEAHMESVMRGWGGRLGHKDAVSQQLEAGAGNGSRRQHKAPNTNLKASVARDRRPLRHTRASGRESLGLAGSSRAGVDLNSMDYADAVQANEASQQKRMESLESKTRSA